MVSDVQEIDPDDSGSEDQSEDEIQCFQDSATVQGERPGIDSDRGGGF